MADLIGQNGEALAGPLIRGCCLGGPTTANSDLKILPKSLLFYYGRYFDVATKNSEAIEDAVPPQVQELIERYYTEQETCRGVQGPQTEEACERVDQASSDLVAQSWCFGEGAVDGASSHWEKKKHAGPCSY